MRNYIDNSDQTLQGLTQSRIHQRVLVKFDARETTDDIEFPALFENYPNIDLTQHFKIEKDKVTASQSYKYEKKRRK